MRGCWDADTILAASGIYLFGFTYLYVGIASLMNLGFEGIGWFSLFVAGVLGDFVLAQR